MKKIVLFVVILAAAGGGFYYWKYGQKDVSSLAKETMTAKANRGPIVRTVSTTGRIVANMDVEIKCKASGEIITLPFDISDYVKKGELLVELDPVDEKRAESQARVTLSSAEARLAQAEKNLEIAQLNLTIEKKKVEAALKAAQARYQDAKAKAERLEQLLEKKLASQEDCETAKTSLAQAEAELENANLRKKEIETQEMAIELKKQDVILAQAAVESDKIALSLAEQRVRDTKVYSPIDAVVAVRNVQIGQIISSGISNVGGGTTVMVLSDLSRVFVLASVDESDIGEVRLDLPVKISVDAYPRVQFRGRVKRISTRGATISGVVTFEVKIEVEGRDKSLLRPEMTANVEIEVARVEDTVLIPADGISRKDGKTIVVVSKQDGTTEERIVETGISDGVNTQIIKGLSEGENVVIRKGESESRWSSNQPRGLMPFGPMPSSRGRSQGRR